MTDKLAEAQAIVLKRAQELRVIETLEKARREMQRRVPAPEETF